MSETDAAWQSEHAAAALAPEAELIGRMDMAGFGQSVISVLSRAAEQPGAVAQATLSFAADLGKIWPAAARLWLGTSPPAPAVQDKRFADPSWTDNPAYFAIREAYLATCRLSEDLLAAGSGDATSDGKAQLAAGLLFDAMAPTNFLLTNPAAVKRAFETGGMSLMRGARNFLDDLANNGGRPRQVDTRGFELGVNLAATPGKVVFRNDLIELIQYAPRTAEVHAVPLLASPPWINKYYIMDLAPGRSFFEWAIEHGRTVFAISYRNPDAGMRGVTLDDYLISGPRAAMDVICQITGAPKIDIVGLCLGGALTAMLAAYLAQDGDDRIGSVTLLNTMLDYSEPGVLGVFTDEKTVARLEEQMEADGYLEGSKMAATFDLLRANELIFNYVASNWLMGQSPPPFDLLAWNADSTRMPAAMHSFYLRSLYISNQLARGELELAGERLALSSIKSDTYIVGAINDHIVPWEASYKATHLLGGSVRYVLSSGGHIAGIVNPPTPKAWFEAMDRNRNPATAAKWRAAAIKHGGSWWDDWTTWAGRRAGPMRPPPPMGCERYPALDDAPGNYVRG
jgi:polyhydroxyalkanoate synthase subunit PhaC